MKNISVFIDAGAKTLKFKNPVATYALLLAAEEITVFWKFKNITDVIDNRKFTIKSTAGASDVEKTLEEGYWDFQQIKERLAGEKLELSMNVYNNTCSINNKTGNIVNLGKFGKLLGFPENHELPTNTTTSPNPADVNHGLRWLTVKCDLIDSSKNVDLNGDQSTILAFLPVTPRTRLNSNCYVYDRDYTPRPVRNDIVSEVKFTVESNITDDNIKVDVNVLLNLTLE